MKKNTPRRAPKKIKRPNKKSHTKSNKKIYSLIIITAASILLGLAIGLYYGNQIDEVAHDIQKIATIDIKPEPQEKKELTYEEKTRALEINYVQNVDNNLYLDETDKQTKDDTPVFHYEEPNLEEIDKHIIIKDKTETEKTTQEPSVLTPAPKEEEVEKIVPKQEKEPEKTIHKIKSDKPRLAIIIDDMTTAKQVRSVQNLGYTVNMAFLPPTTGHPNSANIARGLKYFMIHLPLQASSFKYEEENTLHINDSLDKIEKRIQYLKKIYPNTSYLNNHTGSKFTANKVAMQKLFEVLKKYDYTFIDSRTTAKSVASKVSKQYGVKMFSRNIFLDNNKDTRYIQNQLKKAIRSAKKNGLAIAIGHPYHETFQALANSKHLLKDLELVYVQEL